MSQEAADQVVNLSLKSLEVIAKLSGTTMKSLVTFLYAALRSKNKSKGKGRLSSMLKSGKELKVFSIRATDLKTFKEYAKKYGVLYCVVKDRNNVDKMSDIIVRAEDAAKINRIIERFQFADVQDMSEDKENPSSNKDEKSQDDLNDFVDSVLGKDKEPVPQQATEQEVPSEPKFDTTTTKTSVHDDLFEIKKERSKKEETPKKQETTKEHTKTVDKNKQATKNQKVKAQGNTKTKKTKAR